MLECRRSTAWWADTDARVVVAPELAKRLLTSETMEGSVIKVSVFYPNTAGSKFDMAYYLNKHMPMVRQKLGAAVKGVAVEQGLGGGQPGTPPGYLAMGHLL